MLWRMLIGHVSVKNLERTADALPSTPAIRPQRGARGRSCASWCMVSLALGFMNLLPIPILDGGQIVMQTIEWLKGSPLSERLQIVGQQLGMALVVLLMGLALYNDITRQFG